MTSSGGPALLDAVLEDSWEFVACKAHDDEQLSEPFSSADFFVPYFARRLQMWESSHGLDDRQEPVLRFLYENEMLSDLLESYSQSFTNEKMISDVREHIVKEKDLCTSGSVHSSDVDAVNFEHGSIEDRIRRSLCDLVHLAFSSNLSQLVIYDGTFFDEYKELVVKDIAFSYFLVSDIIPIDNIVDGWLNKTCDPEGNIIFMLLLNNPLLIDQTISVLVKKIADLSQQSDKVTRASTVLWKLSSQSIGTAQKVRENCCRFHLLPHFCLKLTLEIIDDVSDFLEMALLDEGYRYVWRVLWKWKNNKEQCVSIMSLILSKLEGIAEELEANGLNDQTIRDLRSLSRVVCGFNELLMNDMYPSSIDPLGYARVVIRILLWNDQKHQLSSDVFSLLFCVLASFPRLVADRIPREEVFPLLFPSDTENCTSLPNWLVLISVVVFQFKTKNITLVRLGDCMSSLTRIPRKYCIDSSRLNIFLFILFPEKSISSSDLIRLLLLTGISECKQRSDVSSIIGEYLLLILEEQSHLTAQPPERLKEYVSCIINYGNFVNIDNIANVGSQMRYCIVQSNGSQYIEYTDSEIQEELGTLIFSDWNVRSYLWLYVALLTLSKRENCMFFERLPIVRIASYLQEKGGELLGSLSSLLISLLSESFPMVFQPQLLLLEDSDYSDSNPTSCSGTSLLGEEDIYKDILVFSRMTMDELLPSVDDLLEIYLTKILQPEVSEDTRKLYYSVWRKMVVSVPLLVLKKTASILCHPSDGCQNILSELIEDPMMLLNIPKDRFYWKSPSIVRMILFIHGLFLCEFRAVVWRKVVGKPSDVKEVLHTTETTSILLLIQLLLLNRSISDDPWLISELDDAVCEEIHREFLQYPQLIHEIHLEQSYPSYLIAVLVERVPSMHVAIEDVPELLRPGRDAWSILFGTVLCSYLAEKDPMRRSFDMCRLCFDQLLSPLSFNSFSHSEKEEISSAVVRVSKTFQPLCADASKMLLRWERPVELMSVMKEME